MNISFYQILAPLLAIVMVAMTISKFRREERTLREVIVQLFFWGAFAITAIFPDYLVQKVEEYTGMKSGVSGILFLSMVLLWLFVIHLLHENEKRAQEITRLVQHLSLKEAQKEKSHGKAFKKLLKD